MLTKTGTEPFHIDSMELDCDLLDFWRWSASDVLSNATRGRIAEFIVAQALDLSTDHARDEWAAFDLQTPSGVKIEVKSGAYVQSWFQAKPSTIMFKVPKTRAWDAATNVQSRESRRQADVYVFAVLAHKDKSTIDPLNVSHWRFYVLQTAVLDARTRSQHSITLPSVDRLCGGSITYAELRKAVEQAAGRELA